MVKVQHKECRSILYYDTLCPTLDLQFVALTFDIYRFLLFRFYDFEEFFFLYDNFRCRVLLAISSVKVIEI